MAILKTRIWQIAPLMGLLCVFFAATLATAQDYSKSYRYGGRIHIPVENPHGEREIIDFRSEVDAGGVLGCDGLDLDAIIDNQMGGLGGISDLSEQLAEAAKTALFRESITRVLANPQVASVMENMQAFAHARISILQEKCNANEIYADVTNKRLESEAMQRCVRETGNMETCQNTDKMNDYLEDVVKDEKWSGSSHQHLCKGGIENNCDWLSLIPNRITAIGDNTPTDMVPPMLNALDVSNMAAGYAVEVINERVQAAEEFISWFGYAKAMQAALHNAPGLPEALKEEVAKAGADFNGAALYTLYDHTSSKACKFSAERGVDVDMAPVMAPSGGGIFPIAGANLETARISSLFGPRVRPCQGCSKFHSGIDLPYPAGTGVVSSVGGVVREASFNSCGGNKVVIEGNDGSLLSYLHLDGFAGGISPGITVDAGTSIGSVGNTGTCTTGAHLHFTVRQNGSVVDPLAWLGGNDNALRRALSEEDAHGLKTLAVARSEEDPDSDFVVDAYKKTAQLSARMANTILCNINRTLHPQVFVNIAGLPGRLGPESRGDIVAQDADERDIFNSLAAGDKGSIVHGLGNVYGHHATENVYRAATNKMAMTLATMDTGEDGMNKPLYKKALADLGMLKFERSNLIDDYNTSCRVAKRIERMMIQRQENIDKARGRRFEGLKGVNREPLDCEMYARVRDDGQKEMEAFTQKEDEDVEKMRQRQKR